MRRVYGADPTQARFDERVARLAASQHGIITRAQAEDLGATRGVIQHRLRTGRWERLGSEVFRVGGSPRTWPQELMAGVLAWGEGAAISHRAAAAVRRLVGFEPGSIELTVPRDRRRVGPGIVHRHPLSRTDVTIVEGIPVTTPARTLIDLASVAPREAIEEAMDDAMLRGMVSLPILRRRLAAIARPGRPGVAVMRLLLDSRDPSLAVPGSVFERRLLRTLLGAGLPAPLPQFEVRIGGRLIAVLDFAYPEARLAIEADGHRWHSGRVRWDRDRARRNRLTLLGWRIIHVTWTDMTRDSVGVIDAVKSALAAGRALQTDLV